MRKRVKLDDDTGVKRSKAGKKSRQLVASNNIGKAFQGEMVMTEQGYMPIDALAKAAQGAQGGGMTSKLMTLGSVATAPVRGTRELLTLYNDAPWLRAITGKIGRAVAETDWVLYAKQDSQGRYVMPKGILRQSGYLKQDKMRKEINTGELKEITNHPILDLLEIGTGNVRLNGFAALEVTQEHIDLVGEAFWLIEKNNLGVPVAFWPIPPAWVSEFPTEKDPQYVFQIPGGNVVKIPTTLVVPFIHPNPANPYGRGTGIARALADEIQIDEYAAKHQKSFFLNRARPDIIVSGQFISKNDAERLERQWLSDHQGFWKSFKPLFFSQKVDIKELSQSFESMQMVQVRKHERDTFVSVFGAPPEKFGIIGESKRSTIAAADYFWNKDLIRPRVEMIRRVLQQCLVPMFDERILLYYDTPVIQDDEFQLEAMRQAPYSVKLNEWREAQGLTSLGEAGEVLAVPLNLTLVPVKGANGKPLTAQEISDLSKPDPKVQAAYAASSNKELVAQDIARDIASTVVDAIALEFKKAQSAT